MFRVRRRGTARLSAALVATGLVAAGAIATAAPASADEQSAGGATATLGGLKTFDSAVIHDYKGDGKDASVSAGLFELDVQGGGTLKTYCIDIFNPTKQDAKYQETSWDQSSLQGNQDAGKILWILKNSFPEVNDLAKLGSAAGVEGLTDKQAAAGTQVAIWRFSDHVKVDAKDANAEKLAKYLEDEANKNGGLNEPKASLSLDPTAVSGKAGEKLGPIKVSTSAASTEVSLDAGATEKKVSVVDKDGKAVTTAANGDELYVDVPADAEAGTATLSVKATTSSVPIGRAFTSIGAKSQTQILAGSSTSTVEATATATWGAKDNEGPIPAITAEKNCAKGGVDIKVTNEGDENFVFELDGEKYTIEAGKTETVLFPVKEDQAYEIKIAMPDGTDKVFSGVLDCKTDSTGGSTPSSTPTPNSVGGSSTGGDSGDLAETGSSNATPVIAGVAVALVVVGGGAVFFLRKRRSTPAGE